LAFELKARGVKDIVALGVQSECCVLETCRGALNADFNVMLLSSAHSTYDATDGKAAAQVEKDIEKLLRDAGVRVHPWNQWLLDEQF
jgi:nicotinamidase-related amidase